MDSSRPKISELIEFLILFVIGGLSYNLVEILFRGYTYFSMFLLGGACFICIGLINEIFPWTMPLISQMFVSMLIVTLFEFIAGVILNIWLGLGVWDYSMLPYNLFGQVSLIFSIGWFFLSVIAIIADDYMRYYLFDEEKPRYKLLY